jgi:predicted P-loop ATPase
MPVVDDIRNVLAKRGIQIRFNEFTGVLMFGRDGLAEHPMDDLDRAEIQCAIHDATRKPGRPKKGADGTPEGIGRVYPNILEAAMLVIGREAAFHPVRDYLDWLQWDGQLRLDRWLSVHMGAEDTPYTRAVGRMVLEAACRRVRQPGCKFDECLVLVGAEGIGKSTVLRALGSPWFSDSLPLGAGPKETVERTTGVWICESAELIGNSPAKVHEIKAFLSRQEDGPFRAAYGHTSTMRPRQFVPIATTNDTVFLHSTTGDRRFWPVRVHFMDADIDRDQLWAEASWREKLGEPIRLAEGLWDDAQASREQYRAEDPWESTLREITAQSVPLSEIWRMLDVSVSKASGKDAQRVAAIMTRLGYEKSRALRDGKRTTWYDRINPYAEHNLLPALPGAGVEDGPAAEHDPEDYAGEE